MEMMRKLFRDESGQAMVEYIIGLVMAVAFVSALAIGFRRITKGMWLKLTHEIAAACPSCPFRKE
jgi:Flp pilus assembly pilin Flp